MILHGLIFSIFRSKKKLGHLEIVNFRSVFDLSKLSRRDALKFLAAGPVACSSKVANNESVASDPKQPVSAKSKEHTLVNPIRSIKALPQGPWPTEDPFLFCVHHNDQYPKGNSKFGPNSSLQGRQIGTDFSGKDGWSMYHGDVVPGFLVILIVDLKQLRRPRRSRGPRGFIGRCSRYGRGDVQWLTAGMD